MSKSTSISSTAVSNESITFGEGVKGVNYYGEGSSVTGLDNEAVAALSTGYRDVASSGFEAQAATAAAGYETIEKVVGNIQRGTEQALRGIDQAYSKSVSGTAALESLKPFLVGGLALAAIAVLSSTFKR